MLCPMPITWGRVIPWVIPWDMACCDGGITGNVWFMLWVIPEGVTDCPPILCGIPAMGAWFIPDVVKAVVEPHPD